MSSSLLLALLEAPLETAGDDPFSMLAGSGRQLFILIAIIPAAVFVFWYGSRQFSRHRGGSSLRPVGRVLRGFRRTRPAQWRQTVRTLEQSDPTPIAKAKSGTVRIRGRLVTASGNLGGEPGRECVWRNRAGARPESAVGADLVVIADDSGKCGIEDLERAYVIATADKHSFHHENVSLYLGDEVEVFGTFDRELVGDDPDPTQNVYGTVASVDGLDVRLVKRPSAEPAATADEPDSTAPKPQQDSK